MRSDFTGHALSGHRRLDMHERSYCTNVNHRGRDCDRPVAPDAPVTMCEKHIREAVLYFVDTQANVAATPGPKAKLAAAWADYYEAAITAPAEVAEDWRAERDAALDAELRQQHETHVVYYLRFADRVKIGTTRRLKQRMSNIPHDELLAIERGAYALEHLRHQQFAAHHITGEWFSFAPDIQSHCTMLRKHHPDLQIT